MVRTLHPVENIELIINYAETLKWSVRHDDMSKHCWGRLHCNTTKYPNSVMSIWLQPRFPLIHNKQIIKNLRCLNVKRKTGVTLIDGEKRKLYDFTVKLNNTDQMDAHLETTIYQNHCDDTLIHSIDHNIYLHCSRVADNLDQAVETVRTDLQAEGYQLQLMVHAEFNSEA